MMFCPTKGENYVTSLHKKSLNLLLMGGSIAILTKESYHYAMSREMTLGALVFHGMCAWTHRPFDG